MLFSFSITYDASPTLFEENGIVRIFAYGLNKTVFMSRNKNYGKSLGIIALGISLVTFIVLIIILFNIESIGPSTDFSSLLVGALAMITTVLIGFQIANIVQLDKRFDYLEERMDKNIENSLREQVQISIGAAKMAENDAIGTALMMLAWSFIEKGEIDDALRTLINSLRAFQQGNLNDPTILDEMHDVEESLITIAESDKNVWLFRNIDEKNVFIDTAMKIQDKEKMNKLLDFFYRFGIQEST